MRKSIRGVQAVFVCGCVALAAGDVGAQVRVTPGIGMGCTRPLDLGPKFASVTGRTLAVISSGFTLAGGAELTYAHVPVSLRPELTYTRYTDMTEQAVHQISGSLNAVVPLWHGFLSPFLISGVGISHFSQFRRMMNMDTGSPYGGYTALIVQPPLYAVGLSVGGGVEFSLGSVHGRLEATYCHLRSLPGTRFRGGPDTYVPITLAYLFK